MTIRFKETTSGYFPRREPGLGRGCGLAGFGVTTLIGEFSLALSNPHAIALVMVWPTIESNASSKSIFPLMS